MPHFVIDCSKNILTLQQPDTIMQEVHKAATDTGLFDETDIKVRLNPFKEYYLVGGKKGDFIHVFANIMEGRTTEQKAILSKQIVSQLKALFLTIPFIAINIRDFEKATYCNKDMI
ncbi:5-carboxymethyl-2-hydroxymuconate Delta-isomerase [Flavivirga rizhaonensis]|uniref:5-carboxymethyl-2-hydroxymuconate Delta-isomerase n=1 Tax=Flavivirga rizhaonensis TaxID=2559571 RepID=A0A4V3P530_9FLAO|nr:5-carboxymethyl-2-hydroxymuconate Delta-isomerase [Flavivirga rizhaonensis]TGV03754.1 5-carboxymethyl-2-hydroxymuconate Delta-isomerase [Flavivirga rizhaonensis]